jgi:aminoglycoside 6'-N-acetyltransferase
MRDRRAVVRRYLVGGGPFNRKDRQNMISFRPARPSDLELLCRWDTQPHIIAARANGAWGDEHELARTPEWREQLIFEHQGRPIGFVQIIDPAREDSHYWGDVEAGLRAVDLWIGAAADLGRGYGTEMMRLALTRCISNPAVSAVLVDPLASNTRACRFFERMGFQLLERRHFGDDDCCVYRLAVERPH